MIIFSWKVLLLFLFLSLFHKKSSKTFATSSWYVGICMHTNERTVENDIPRNQMEIDFMIVAL